VTNARETRVTGIVAHVLVLLSLLLIPYPIAYIPRAVLNGLFLYMAVTSLDGLQIFERILLLVTEQVSFVDTR
jgi:sodium borate transporter 11